MCPEAADRAQHDRVVEEDVGEQDRPDRLVEAEAPEGAARAEQRDERRTHDDRREHEGHGDERTHHAPPAEAVPAHDVGARQRDDEGQRGRQRRLPDGEPQHVPQRRVRDDVGDRGEVERRRPARARVPTIAPTG